MTEGRYNLTIEKYEGISKTANDLYKEAESLAGVNEELFIEKLRLCAFLEERVFYMSERTGVGSLIRNAHARYAVQNFFRAGLYAEVIRFGQRAVEILQDSDSQKTADQINHYINASREKISP